MKESKSKLINSLIIAIDALKNDTIFYDWSNQCSCNAGVVSQAVLGINASKLDEMREDVFLVMKTVNASRKENNQKELPWTWKNAVQNSCSITGKDLPKIIRDLEAAGLTRSDIVHLEYLENPAILAASGIKKVKTVNRVKVGQTERTEIIPSSSFIGRLLGKKIHKAIVEPIYDETVTEEYPTEYFQKKENLILYLSAWVKILQNEAPLATDSQRLNAELLNAVADENYERAAEIRNQLSLIHE